MIYDLVIIGLGVAGVNAAIYAKRSGLNVLAIEGDTPGGLMNKTNLIENYPGFKSISGPDLAFNMFEQFNMLNVPLKSETVLNLEINGNFKKVTTNKSIYNAKSVIIASGRIPKKLGLENEEEFVGKGLSYCHLCDGNLYKDKITCVIGGGNSAVSGAIYLSNICKKVYLIVRKDYLKADNVYQQQLSKCKNVEILYNSKVENVALKEGIINKVILNNNEEIESDGIFINIGYEPATNFCSDLNITDEEGFIVVNGEMETSIPGVFAAGDTIKKQVYQIITAASEGAIAGISAYNYINYKFM